MAVYNVARFLREAVDSVLAQTFADFELVVIDDGSTDDSAAILATYADPRLVVIRQPNAGLIASLNAGIRAARGELIARMDPDDRCEPNRLAVQVAYLDAHPEVTLLGSAVATMDEDGRPLAPRVSFPATHVELWSTIGRRPWVFCHPAVVFRRAAAVAAGLYDPRYEHAEETEFFARLMAAHAAANLPDVLLSYRIRRGAMSLNNAAHGLVHAEMVAATIDRWRPGEPFAATAAERAAADARIAALGGKPVTPAFAEAAYHVRLGRELLRGRRWAAAARHYATAARLTPLDRRPYLGLGAAALRRGGAA